MTQSLDDLMQDALAHLPAVRKHGVVSGPALPLRTQHHTPLESESRFIRFAAWWDEEICERCGHAHRRFDDLFEEREWVSPEEHVTSRHWLKAPGAPLSELLKDAVSYVRYHKRAFCENCLKADQWPLAKEYRE